MTTERRDKFLEHCLHGIPEEEITEEFVDALKGTYGYWGAELGDKFETLFEALKSAIKEMVNK